MVLYKESCNLSRFIFVTISMVDVFPGFIARLKFFDPLDDKDFYSDAPYWEVRVEARICCIHVALSHNLYF